MRNLHENNRGKFPNDERERTGRTGERTGYMEKVCEQLTDITSGMSEEEKQDYEKKIRAKLQRGANLSVEELNYLRIHNPGIISKCNACKNSKTTTEKSS